MTVFRNIEYYWIDKEWIGNRMLFLSGPRQVGKTELVKSRLCLEGKGYFNWDSKKLRMLYAEDEDFFIKNLTQNQWVCFDEIHKRNQWKDILKGIYDNWKEQYHFVITGSARLDLFKKHGDSLFGRYFTLHQFPLSLGDFHKTKITDFTHMNEIIGRALDSGPSEFLQPLLQYGGFPEPLFQASEQFWRRWDIQHRDLILSEDLPQLSKIEELDKVEILLERLRSQVGSPISLRKTAIALETNHHSISRWIAALEKVQLVFRLKAISLKLPKVNSTDEKIYMIDWRSAKKNIFENFVASCLYRASVLWKDILGREIDVNILRSHSGHEVDFILVESGKPILAVEVKEGKPQCSELLKKTSTQFHIPAVVVTAQTGYKTKTKDGIYFLSWEYLGQHLP